MSKNIFYVFLVAVFCVGIFLSLREGHRQKNPGEGGVVQLAGKEVFYGKGRCGICHTMDVGHSGKCPNLNGAGSRLTRDFIYESMTKPSAYVKLDFDAAEPSFYPARMPAVNQAPIGLTEGEMQNVIAFIESYRR